MAYDDEEYWEYEGDDDDEGYEYEPEYEYEDEPEYEYEYEDESDPEDDERGYWEEELDRAIAEGEGEELLEDRGLGTGADFERGVDTFDALWGGDAPDDGRVAREAPRATRERDTYDLLWGSDPVDDQRVGAARVEPSEEVPPERSSTPSALEVTYDPQSWEGRAYNAAVAAGHPDPLQFVEQIRWESGNFDPNVIAGRRSSTAGAEGIAQIMRQYHPGVDPLDPDAALSYAARLMKTNYDRYGDPSVALAAYNAGPNAVSRYGGVPPFAETRKYIQVIGERTAAARQAQASAVPSTEARQQRQQQIPLGHYDGDGHDHGVATPYTQQQADRAGNVWTIAFDFDAPYSNPFNAAIPRHRGVDLVIPDEVARPQGLGHNGMGYQYPAFRSGTVAAITNDPHGGIGVIVDTGDPNARYDRYFHNSAVNVRVGDRVEAGQTRLGAVGQTGTEGFPHLHYEVSQHINGDPMGQTIDPRPYMSRPVEQEAAARPAAAPTDGYVPLRGRSAAQEPPAAAAAPRQAPEAEQRRQQAVLSLPTETRAHLSTWQQLREARGEDPTDVDAFRRHLRGIGAQDPWARSAPTPTPAPTGAPAAPEQPQTRTVYTVGGREVSEAEYREAEAENARRQAARAEFDAGVARDREAIEAYGAQVRSWQAESQMDPYNVGPQPTRPETPYLNAQLEGRTPETRGAETARTTRQVEAVRQQYGVSAPRPADLEAPLSSALEDAWAIRQGQQGQAAAAETASRNEYDRQVRLLELGRANELQQDPLPPTTALPTIGPARPARVNEQVRQWYLDRGYSEENATREATLDPGDSGMRPPAPILPAPRREAAEIAAEQASRGEVIGDRSPLGRIRDSLFRGAYDTMESLLVDVPRFAAGGIAESPLPEGIRDRLWSGLIEQANANEQTFNWGRAELQRGEVNPVTGQQYPPVPMVRPPNFQTDWSDPVTYGELMAESAPTLALALGTGGAAGALGTAARLGPRAASVAARAGSGGLMFGLGGSDAYRDAMEHGADRQSALAIGTIVGGLNAYIENAPLTEWVGRAAGRPVQQATNAALTRAIGAELTERAVRGLDNGVVRQIGSRFEQGIQEGTEEVLQGLISNGAAMIHDRDQDLFEGVLEGFVGGLLPGMALGSTQGLAARARGQAPTAQAMRAPSEVTAAEGVRVLPSGDWRTFIVERNRPDDGSTMVNDFLVRVEEDGRITATPVRDAGDPQAPRIDTAEDRDLAVRNVGMVYDWLERQGALSPEARAEAHDLFARAARDGLRLVREGAVRTMEAARAGEALQTADQTTIDVEGDPAWRVDLPEAWSEPTPVAGSPLELRVREGTDPRATEELGSLEATRVLGTAASNLEQELTVRLRDAGVLVPGEDRPFGLVFYGGSVNAVNHGRARVDAAGRAQGPNAISLDLGQVVVNAITEADQGGMDWRTDRAFPDLVARNMVTTIAHEVAHDLFSGPNSHTAEHDAAIASFARVVEAQHRALRPVVSDLWGRGSLQRLAVAQYRALATSSPSANWRSHARSTLLRLSPADLRPESAGRSRAVARPGEAGVEGGQRRSADRLPEGGVFGGRGAVRDRGAIAGVDAREPALVGSATRAIPEHEQLRAARERAEQRGVERIRAEANDYVRSAGIRPAVPPTAYVRNDVETQRRIAAFYQETPSDPSDPEVRRAYAQMAREVDDQYDYLVSRGVRFIPYYDERPAGDGSDFHGYADSPSMIRDLAENNRLYVYADYLDHPLLSPPGTPYDQSGNWKFRAVHDYFGHAAQGFEFGPRGEESAWLEHVKMFSPLAARAMTTETRGQNSWVNFGPQAEGVALKDRPFAEQKVLLLPGWALSRPEAYPGEHTNRVIAAADDAAGADGSVAMPSDGTRQQAEYAAALLGRERGLPEVTVAHLSPYGNSGTAVLTVGDPETAGALAGLFAEAGVVTSRRDEAGVHELFLVGRDMGADDFVSRVDEVAGILQEGDRGGAVSYQLADVVTFREGDYEHVIGRGAGEDGGAGPRSIAPPTDVPRVGTGTGTGRGDPAEPGPERAVGDRGDADGTGATPVEQLAERDRPGTAAPLVVRHGPSAMVPEAVARLLPIEPQTTWDPSFVAALENTEGAELLPGGGVTFQAIRDQNLTASGRLSPRTLAYYRLNAAYNDDAYRGTYAQSRVGVGIDREAVRVKAPTTFMNPLVYKGGVWVEDHAAQISLATGLEGYGEAILEDVRDALRRDGATAANVAAILGRNGGDPSVAPDMVRAMDGQIGNERGGLADFIITNILAQEGRRNGYDGVVTWTDTHPLFGAAMPPRVTEGADFRELTAPNRQGAAQLHPELLRDLPGGIGEAWREVPGGRRFNRERSERDSALLRLADSSLGRRVSAYGVEGGRLVFHEQPTGYRVRDGRLVHDGGDGGAYVLQDGRLVHGDTAGGTPAAATGATPSFTTRGDVEALRPRATLGARQVRAMADDALATHLEHGGSTVNVERGNLGGASEYSVSIYPERGIVVEGREPTSDDLATFVKQNADLLSDPRNSLGTWFNAADGNHYIDVSVTVPDRALAEDLGRLYNQIAIFGLEHFEEIPTGGSGQIPSRSLPPEMDRLPLVGGQVAAARARLGEQMAEAAGGAGYLEQALREERQALSEARDVDVPLARLLERSAADHGGRSELTEADLKPFAAMSKDYGFEVNPKPTLPQDVRRIVAEGVSKGWATWYVSFPTMMENRFGRGNRTEMVDLFANYSSQLDPLTAWRLAQATAIAARENGGFADIDLDRSEPHPTEVDKKGNPKKVYPDRQRAKALILGVLQRENGGGGGPDSLYDSAVQYYQTGMIARGAPKTSHFNANLLAGLMPWLADYGVTGDVHMQRGLGYRAWKGGLPGNIDMQKETAADDRVWRYVQTLTGHVADELGIVRRDAQAAFWVAQQRSTVPGSSAILGGYRKLNPNAPVFKDKAKLARWREIADLIRAGETNIGLAYDELSALGIFALEDPADLKNIVAHPNVVNLQAAWNRAGYSQVGWPGYRAEGRLGGPIGGGTFRSTSTRPMMRGGMRYLTDTGVDTRTVRGQEVREPREQPLARQLQVEAPLLTFEPGEDPNTRHIRDLWDVPNVVTWGGGDLVGIALPTMRIARDRLAAVAQAVADGGGVEVRAWSRVLPGEEPTALSFTLDRRTNALLPRQVDALRGAVGALGAEVQWDGRYARILIPSDTRERDDVAADGVFEAVQSSGLDPRGIEIGRRHVDTYQPRGGAATEGAQPGDAPRGRLADERGDVGADPDVRPTDADIGRRIAERLGAGRVRARGAAPPAGGGPSASVGPTPEVVDPFYSQLTRTITARMPNRASPQQVRGLLRGQVKDDELRWTGFDEYLDSAEREGRTLNKQEVLDYLRDNEVELDEVVLGNRPSQALGSASIEQLDRQRRDAQVALEGLTETIAGTLFADEPRFVAGNHARYYAQAVAGLAANDGELLADVGLTLETARAERLRLLALLEEGSEAQQAVLRAEVAWTDFGMAQRVYGEMARPSNRPTVWDRYNDGELVLPGGENYRELLVILPETVSTDVAPERRVGPYKHGHWEGFRNVIGHLRMTDRRDREGRRVLLLEEVQSDWHQQGREHGYADAATRQAEIDAQTRVLESSHELMSAFGIRPDGGPRLEELYYTDRDGLIVEALELVPARVIDTPTTRLFMGTEEIERLRREREGTFDVRVIHASTGTEATLEWHTSRERILATYTEDGVRRLATPDELTAIRDYESRMRDWDAARRSTRDRRLPPEAPFAKTWPQLLLRRAIRWAAEHGYDRLAWTPGRVQIERYPSLQDQVSTVKYDPMEGRLIIVLRNGEVPVNELVPRERIRDYIGADPAERLDAAIEAWYEDDDRNLFAHIQGDDLVMGGEGMRTFYDRMLVNDANKLVKKWGAKVGTMQVPIPEQGYHLEEKRYGWEVRSADGTLVLSTGDEQEARAELERRNRQGGRDLEVWSVDVTPQMKESVLNEGQPLFSTGPVPVDPFYSGLQRLAGGLPDVVNPEAARTVPGRVVPARVIRTAAQAKGQRPPADRPIVVDEAGNWVIPERREADRQTPARGAADQVLAYLRERGAKDEEIAWTGLEDWLRGQEGPITRDDVLAYLDTHQVRVDEVLYGGQNRSIEEIDREMDALHDQGDLATDLELRRRYDELMAERTDVQYGTTGPAPTRYQQVTLPGGDNYRELLLTLPQRPPDMPPYEEWLVLNGAEPARMTKSAHRAARAQYARGVNPRGPGTGAEAATYTSGHWNEPNILAHIRFNERQDAEGNRVLFVEEIQSDWHQAGRKHGYRGEGISTEGWEARPEGDSRPWQRYAVFGADGRRITQGRYAGPPEDAIRVVAEILEGDRPPDAPFKKTWPELAFRRMVRWAAEHGFDRIGWTTGQQQNERYSLNDQVRTLAYNPDTGLLRVYLRNHQGGPRNFADVAPEDLPRHIGEEMTERLLARPRNKQGNHALSGLEDFRLEGAGMKGFYDRILVDLAGRLGKPFGARVGTTQIYTDVRSRDAGRAEWRIENAELGEHLDITVASREEAQQYADDLGEGWVVASTGPEIHVLDVTPAMKRSALLEGQPLFNIGPSPEQPELPGFEGMRVEADPNAGQPDWDPYVDLDPELLDAIDSMAAYQEIDDPDAPPRTDGPEEIPEILAPIQGPVNPERMDLGQFPDWAQGMLTLGELVFPDAPQDQAAIPDTATLDILQAVMSGPNGATLSGGELSVLAGAIKVQYDRLLRASERGGEDDWRAARVIEEARRYTALMGLATSPRDQWPALGNVWASAPISGGRGQTLDDFLREQRSLRSTGRQGDQRLARQRGVQRAAQLVAGGRPRLSRPSARRNQQTVQTVGSAVATVVRTPGVTPRGVARAVADPQDLSISPVELILAMRYNNMLLGPRGILVDYVSNSGQLLYKLLTDPTLPEAGGANPRARAAITAAELAAVRRALPVMMKRISETFLDGVSDAQAASTGTPKTLSGRLTARIEAADAESRRVDATVLRAGKVGTIAFAELAGRLKGIADVGITTLAYGAEQARQAGIIAWQEGRYPVGSDDWHRRVAEIMEGTGIDQARYEEMVLNSTREAERTTYRGEMGFVGRKILEPVHRHPIGQLVLPFLRALYHIRGWAIDLSPLGAAVTTGDVMRAGVYRGMRRVELGRDALARTRNFGGLAGGPYQEAFRGNRVGPAVADLDRRMLANLLGTSAFMWLVGLAMEGGLSGSGPPDDPITMLEDEEKPDYEAIKLRGTLEASGWQRYSIRIPWGGQHYWVGYSNWGPLGYLMGAAAALGEAYRYGLPPGTERSPRSSWRVVGGAQGLSDLVNYGDAETTKTAARRFFGVTKDMSYLTGLMDLYGLYRSLNTVYGAGKEGETPSEAIKRRRRGQAEAGRYVGNLVTSLVPGAQLVNTIAQSQDRVDRAVEYGSIKQQVANRIPELGGAVPPSIAPPSSVVDALRDPFLGSSTGRRQGLPERVDAMGRPVENRYAGVYGWLPFRASREDLSNESLRALIDAKVGVPTPPTEIYYNPPGTKTDPVWVQITPRMRQEMARIAGQRIDRKVGELLKEVPEAERRADPDAWHDRLSDAVKEVYDQVKREEGENTSIRDNLLAPLSQMSDRVRPFESKEQQAAYRGEAGATPTPSATPTIGPPSEDGANPTETPRPAATPTASRAPLGPTVAARATGAALGTPTMTPRPRSSPGATSTPRPIAPPTRTPAAATGATPSQAERDRELIRQRARTPVPGR